MIIPLCHNNYRLYHFPVCNLQVISEMYIRQIKYLKKIMYISTQKINIKKKILRHLSFDIVSQLSTIR